MPACHVVRVHLPVNINTHQQRAPSCASENGIGIRFLFPREFSHFGHARHVRWQLSGYFSLHLVISTATGTDISVEFPSFLPHRPGRQVSGSSHLIPRRDGAKDIQSRNGRGAASIGTCPAGISSQISRQLTKLETENEADPQSGHSILVKSKSFAFAGRQRFVFIGDSPRSDLEATKCRVDCVKYSKRQSNDTGSSRRPLS